MKIFLDTANLAEIREVLRWGKLISGITTNQKILCAEKGCNFKDRVFEILSLVDGPLSVELTNTAGSDDDLVEEAVEYSSWNPKNIVVKVPMFGDGRGLRIVSRLKKKKIKTNVTCLITVNQVLLAANAGGTYASIFFNRVRDAGLDAVKTIQESMHIIEEGGLSTKIIVGSIRKPEDVHEIAVAGPHVITIPYKILMQMPFHQKTEDTIKEFDQAWLEFKKAEASAAKTST